MNNFKNLKTRSKCLIFEDSRDSLKNPYSIVKRSWIFFGNFIKDPIAYYQGSLNRISLGIFSGIFFEDGKSNNSDFFRNLLKVQGLSKNLNKRCFLK